MDIIRSDEILPGHDKIKAFVLKDPTRVDDDDVNLFLVKPPPAAVDLNLHAPIECMAGNLCHLCRSALEFFSFWLAVNTAAKTAEEKEALETLPPGCTVHIGSRTLEQGEAASCHLCALLMAKIRVKRIAMHSIAQSNIEMCWQSRADKPPTLHFAVFHRGHPRATNNYLNILRLRFWSASEFDVGLLGRLERHSNTSSAQSASNCLQWLRRCQADEDGKHRQCNTSSAGWLPTRLLDVDSVVATSRLKLVTPRDTPGAFVSDKRYMTLSHCWGRVALPTLTTQNLAVRLRDGIPLSQLPKTFRDAAQVAHWFRVRWLWIDSLCILQDSEADWQREAVMMYSVYKNALLNISADDSPDATWGLFREREPAVTMPMSLGFPRVFGGASFFLTEDAAGVFESVNSTPLAKRGWVFQERQLSRRILHFTSHEIIWECCAAAPYAATETFPGGTPFNTAFLSSAGGKPKFQSQIDVGNPTDVQALYTTWDTLCKEYSGKAFTHVRDKLVALSGLAQQFQVAFPHDEAYLAGMWQSCLPQNLLWEAEETSAPFGAEEYVAPSWSWAAINGPIARFGKMDDRPSHSLVEVLSIDTKPAIPSNPTGMLKSASLKLRCYLRPVEVRPDYTKRPWYMMAMRSGGKAHRLTVKHGDGREAITFDNFHSNAFYYSFDVLSDQNSGPESVPGYFLPLCMSQPDEYASLVLSGLLIEKIGDDDDSTYRRLGVIHVYHERCHRIKYTVRDDADDNWNTWTTLSRLLVETHECFQKLRSERGGSQKNWRKAGSGEVEEKIGREKKEKGEKNDEAAFHETLERLEIGSGGSNREIDLESVSPLERLYYLDTTALAGSKVDGKLERMVPQEITLV
ncbi:heterokaryon incompatibility protein-domain-containing protein [Echria macrotheca]|uniref:Heterokaryon incompatibility protein-domain-containing protein n=1 Tax=Echria macrotheca TaxID=438768 RepID=A0AAJ0BKX5_9PEZI|nr:heterokaryon incompatibility protein-domain-containing protein [Echria macrotheca]